MAANSAIRPFGRKSVAAAVEPAKFQAVRPQSHSKSRLLQKETWSGRFLSPFVQRVFRPDPSNASARVRAKKEHPPKPKPWKIGIAKTEKRSRHQKRPSMPGWDRAGLHAQDC